MKNLLIGLAVLASSTSLFAQGGAMGGHDGGGGQGVVCYEGSTIKSVELLDFYEGKVLDGLETEKFSGDYLNIYQEVVKAKSPSSRMVDYMKYAGEVIKFSFLPKGERLTTINDSGSFIIPSNCKIEQIANFQGVKRIFIVSDFWEKMSPTDKAGLYMHEYLWFRERLQGVPKSVRARRNVARYFAKNFSFPVDPMEAKVGDIDCVAAPSDSDEQQPTGFLMSKIEGTNNCKLSFYDLNGERVLNKHEAIFEGCDEYKFSEPQLNYPVDISSSVLVTDEQTGNMTHSIRMSVESKATPESNFKSYERIYKLKVTNLEFPGISDEKQLRFYCNAGITEDDIQNPWW